MNPSRAGTLIAGTWLVGVGLVFLVQQTMDLPWSQAWPLWVILGGVGSGVSALVGLAGRDVRAMTIMWALIWPVLITALGVAFFLDLADVVAFDTIGLIVRWWPSALIVIGLLVLLGGVLPGGREQSEALSIGLGGATEGEVRIAFGAGRLDVGAGTRGRLVEGTFEGGVVRHDIGPGRVELKPDAARLFPWLGQQLRWRVGLAPDVPLRLTIEGGASKSELRLEDLTVTSLVVKTGASDTRIWLPRTGETKVRVESGAASVTIEVPVGVAARIRTRMTLGSSTVDDQRFPKVGDEWISPDYATATNRAEMHLEGGVGSVRIV